jgi:2-iminobutanoate/2-iminopropanoate deaminase
MKCEISHSDNKAKHLRLNPIDLNKNQVMKKVIQIPGAPAPIGPYSQAILKGDTLYVSGQIPLNPFTGELVTESIDAATERVMLNIEALLKEAGMNFNHIVKCSIFLKNMDDFAVMNGVYAGFFDDFPPARETVQVSKLPLDVPVEISCIAIR